LQQQPDQGTTQTNDDNDDKPSVKDKTKPSKRGGILEELPQTAELTAKKRGSKNNDDSPTPPACPTDNSPIPPDCTLKPKF
jgi:hypothetical protein